MRFLPFERLALFSPDPPEVVAERLGAAVATRRFYWTRPPQPFRGAVRGMHFKAVRDLGLGRNSWRPVVVGDLVRVPGGTEVRVRMRLSWLVGAFSALMMAAWSWGGAAAAMGSLEPNPGPASASEVLGALAVPLGIGAFIYLLASASFWSEAKRARHLLCEYLGCRIEGPEGRRSR